MAGPRQHYGFRFNDTRDGYDLDEEKMSVVKRIFHMVGVEGMTRNAVRRTLENDYVPSPSGARHWSSQYLSKCIHDVYLAHIFAEISQLVSPEVTASLDPSLSLASGTTGQHDTFTFTLKGAKLSQTGR